MAEQCKRRERSHEIVIGVAMTALIVAGCGAGNPDRTGRCVDRNNVVVADAYCRDDDSKDRGWTGGGYGGGFHYYYGGSGYARGETARGGTLTPARGFSGRVSGFLHGTASKIGSVTRGGFGGSAAAHGSGS